MTTRLDNLLSRETCFVNFDDLLSARGGYRPTIDVSTEDRLELADAYDEAMTKRGDLRRAFRTGRTPEEQKINEQNRNRRAYETRNGNELTRAHADALQMNLNFDIDHEVLTMTRREIVAEIESLERDLLIFKREVRKVGQDPIGAVSIVRKNLVGMNRLLGRAPFESQAQFAQHVTKLARDCMADAKREPNRFHFTHRGVEVIGLDKDGERIGSHWPEFLEVNQISGKAIARCADTLKGYDENVVAISVQGGLDAHDSFADFMASHHLMNDSAFDDYEPNYSCWDSSDAPISLFK